MMVDVCFPVRGGVDAAVAAAMTPVYVGFNTSSRPPQGVDLDWNFIDWPFEGERETQTDINRAVRRHRAFVEANRPRYAVAPDVTDEIGGDRALELADDLDQYAETVIVVPKTDELPPAEVPDRYRVGIPNMQGVTQPFSVREYRRADSVHILGGSFKSQLNWRDFLSNIGSVDTSSGQVSAFPPIAEFWNGVQNVPIPEEAGNVGYSAMALSYKNYARTWGMDRPGGSFIPDRAFSKGMSGSPFTDEKAIIEALPNAENVRVLAEKHIPGAEVVEFDDDFPVVIELPQGETDQEIVGDLTSALRQMYEVEINAVRGAEIIRVERKNRWPQLLDEPLEAEMPPGLSVDFSGDLGVRDDASGSDDNGRREDSQGTFDLF